MKKRLADLDYFRTKDDVIFIIKGYYHPLGRVIASPVFWPSPDGERLHSSGRRYDKAGGETDNARLLCLRPDYFSSTPPKHFAKVPVADIVEFYDPRAAFRKFLKDKRPSVWRDIAKTFRKLAGVPHEDTGIFGSYLVGLSRLADGRLKKDIDFNVYGLANLHRLECGGLQKIRNGLGLGPISPEHLAWHAKKYGASHNPKATNFPETLKRKWSSLQIAPGILSTVRFVYKEDEIPPDPLKSPPREKIRLIGRVGNAEGTNFVPRVFSMVSSGRHLRVVTYFWAFQSPVRTHDLVEITGTLHADGTTVSIDDLSEGIKILE